MVAERLPKCLAEIPILASDFHVKHVSKLKVQGRLPCPQALVHVSLATGLGLWYQWAPKSSYKTSV